MTLTYRSTAGRRLTVTEGDGNIAHLAAADGITFVQSGTGAVARTVQAKLRDWVSVVDFGALGDGSTDDSTAFTNAAAAVGAGGTIYVPAGTFILNDWTPTAQINIVGAGAPKSGSSGTILKAKTGATYVLVLSGLVYCRLAQLQIDGNAKASSGVKVLGGASLGSQNHSFEYVVFANCSVGMKVDAGTVTQADKNIYIRCKWQDNTTGLWVNSANAQNQLILGGSFDTHTTAIRLTSGAIKWIGGQVQTATTGILLDGANTQDLSLEQVYMEDLTTDIDGTSSWPDNGVYLLHCFLQGTGDNIILGQNSAFLKATMCNFGTGGISASGNDTVVIDELCTFSSGSSYTASGTSNRRHSTTQNGTVIYTGSTVLLDIRNTGGVGFYKSSPSNEITLSRSRSAADVVAQVANEEATNAASHARVDVQTAGGSGGDPYARFTIAGAVAYSIGVDNSDSDKFKLSKSNNLGGTDVVTWDSNGVPNICAATATPANGSTSARLIFGTTAGFGIYYGSGAPTVSAAQGSLYLRSDGTTTNDRAYINTNGSTTWTALTTAA